MCPCSVDQERQEGHCFRCVEPDDKIVLFDLCTTNSRLIVPNDGCLNFVDENDEVLLAGFGRKGKAKGDIPGVRFKVVKVSGVGLLALWKEKKEKPRS